MVTLINRLFKQWMPIDIYIHSNVYWYEIHVYCLVMINVSFNLTKIIILKTRGDVYDCAHDT